MRLVCSKWEKPAIAQRDQRPARKYYSVTKEGEMALEAAVRRYPLLEHIVPNLPPKEA